MAIEFKAPISQNDVSGIAVHWTSYQHISGLSGHAGLDFPMPDGTPIRASADGKIIRSFSHSDFGNLIVIDHGEQFHTLYAHMKNDGFVDSSGNLLNDASLSDDGKILVNGQEVSGAKSIKDYLSANYDEDATNDVEIIANSGDVIGFVGDTGIGGTHLHFSILDLNETEAQSLGKKDGEAFGVFELPNSLIPWKDVDSDGDGTIRSDADYTNNRLAQYNAVLNIAPEIAALADHPNEVTNWEGRWDEGFTTFATLNPTDSSSDASFGAIERNGDKDWFRLETTDGRTYEITVSGTAINGFQSLSDPFFTVKKLDETTGIFENILEGADDRTDMSGSAETISFTANGGEYYVVVGGGGDNFATKKGGYSVAVSDTTNAVDPAFPDGGVNETTSFADAADDFGVAGGSEVAELYLKSIFGSVISKVTYTGSENAAFLVSDFEIPGVDIDLEGGILLSSGGLPGSSNTSGGFTVQHGTAGDPDLNEIVAAALPTAGSTQDASILEFDIFVDDEDVDGIRFDIVFGSDEYSEWSNSSFVDVAAVWVDDDRDGNFETNENKALFNGDPTTPLSVIGANLALNFVDNENGTYAIEWDGFGALSVRPDLQQGWNSIKIAVADTGDQRLDSGVYVTNFELLSNGATGEDIFKVVNGAVGQNDLEASETKEEFNLAEGLGSVSGTLKELTGDVVTGFTDQIKLIIEQVNLLKEWLTVTFGSAILNIDEDGDGDVDGTITLEGDFEGAEFNVEIDGENTEITVDFAPEFNTIEGTSDSDNVVGTDAPDIINSLGGRYDKMSGGANADQFVFGAEANNGARERDVILDYEVGFDEIVLQDGASVASVRETSSQVVVFLEGDRDAIYVRGDGVTADNISIVADDAIALV